MTPLKTLISCMPTILIGAGVWVSMASMAADTTPLPEPVAANSGLAASKPDRMAVARDAIKAKDWQKSITELTLQAKEVPGNADTYNLLGYSLRKQAKPDLPKAFEYYRLALKTNPAHKGANEYIGEAYLMNSQPAKAEEHLAALKTICGNTSCAEYQDLAKSIAAYKAKN